MSNRIVWVGVAVGAILAVGVMATYFYALGDLSHQADSWAAFGSVLSAAFTLLATFATLATLITLINQQRQQAAINEEQMKSTRFQQYFAHRELFNDRMKSLEKSFGGEFIFYDLEQLYKKIFPENSPTKCLFTITPIDKQCSDFFGISEKLRRLHIQLLTDYSEEFVLLIPMHQETLLNDLGVKCKREPINGDFLSEKHGKIQSTGINLYNLEESFYIIHSTYENICNYAGAKLEDFSGTSYAYHERLREIVNLYQYANRAYHHYDIWRSNDIIIYLEELYLEASSFVDTRNQYILPYCVSTLTDVLTKRHTLEKTNNNEFVKSLRNILEREIIEKANTHTDEHLRSRFVRFIKLLNCIQHSIVPDEHPA
ncbi:hypothetical protein [Pseudomonas benzopyrenica]|uniref:hypothetical protein n=1 Tax=Pseudomonas benzopyrenica TaxID=2993566 RepID=UPI003F18F13E